MKKNIFKIVIIILCFAFVLLVALYNPKTLPEEENNQKEEVSVEADISEEAKVTEPEPELIELANNPELRILITSENFASDIHSEVRITSNRNFKLLGEDGTLFAKYNAWEEINLDSFRLKSGETLIFEGESKMSVPSLKRAQGIPEYYGSLQIYKEEDGYSIINIVPMEEYLLTVVPSEMPSTYPLEALKAQAICARSYAYHHVLNSSGLLHEANMNDSTDFQVYNNIHETDATNQAVKETEGMLLTTDGMPVSTYFFSTSCGFTTNESVWKEYFGGEEFEEGMTPSIEYQAGSADVKEAVLFAPVAVAEKQAVEAISTDSGVGILYTADALSEENNFQAYLQSDAKDFLEAEEQWYRWTYRGKISSEQIQERMKARYQVRPDLILTLNHENENYVNRPIGIVGKITNIEVIKRLDGGVADELLIETDKDTYLVIGEYNIRYVLSDGLSEIVRNDGSVVTVSNLLPSAYFIIEPETVYSNGEGEIFLTGGGYGHGVGMSQNGAKQAAMQGMTYDKILALFYKELELVRVD